MKAFEEALGILFLDPNLSVEASYTAEGGTARSVRIMTRRADVITSFGDARLWSETTRVDIRVADLAEPRPGDRVEIDGEAYLVQGEPMRDRERLVWTLDLCPV